MKSDVTLVFALLDKDEKQVLTFQSVSKGTGSDLGKSAANGIEIAKFTADVAAVNQKICSGGVAIGAESKLKIAVFPFKNNGVVADWYDISQHITDMIITRLINTMAYDVVERTRIETLMEEKKLAMSGVVEQNEAMELAQYAGADLALIGSAAIHGGIIDIDARTVDVKTGIAKGAMSVSGYSLTNLRGLADALVDKLNAGGKKKSKGNCK
jgi:TolB-like protein